jgi:hypothetical protein
MVAQSVQKQISLCEAHHKAYHVGELDREEI